MRSIDRLALGSVICGVVAFALGCLLILGPIRAQYLICTELSELMTVLAWASIGAALIAMTLALAALNRSGVRSGERRGRTQARIGIALGVVQILVLCPAAIVVEGFNGCGS